RRRSNDPRADEPSWPSATENQQIIGDDSEPHPTLHAALAAVSAAPQAMTALERADPSFASCSPAEGEAGNPRADFAGLAREHDVPDSALVRAAFIRRRGKAAIGLAHDRAGDSQEPLVELLQLGLGPRADRRGRPRAGRATALGDLEDPARHAARALADLLPDPAQAAGEHPNPIGQECRVRGV